MRFSIGSSGIKFSLDAEPGDPVRGVDRFETWADVDEWIEQAILLLSETRGPGGAVRADFLKRTPGYK